MLSNEYEETRSEDEETCDHREYTWTRQNMKCTLGSEIRK